MGYRGKVLERERARALRSKGSGCWRSPPSSVCPRARSLWARDVAFTPRHRRSGARRREPNALQRRKAEEIERLLVAGRERIGTLTDKEFLVAGAALYAGEGPKRDGMVRFTNSHDQMVRFFCAWLRRFFSVDEARLRVRLYLHEGLDLNAAVAF